MNNIFIIKLKHIHKIYIKARIIIIDKMKGTHFSSEQDQNVTFSKCLVNSGPQQLPVCIEFGKIIMDQEIIKTEKFFSEFFLGEDEDESTEIDSLLISMKIDESVSIHKNSQQSECEEIFGILKPLRNSEPLKGFSKSTPEFYKHNSKRISLQGKVIKNDGDKSNQNCGEFFSLEKKEDLTHRMAVVRTKPRMVPERVSNPFMKNFKSELADC